MFGRIKPTDKGDLGAEETINHLRLDHKSLTEMRKRAIKEALFRKEQPRSNAQLRKIAQGFCILNTEQRFPNFCFVIEHAANDLIRRIDSERKRKQAIRQQKQK